MRKNRKMKAKKPSRIVRAPVASTKIMTSTAPRFGSVGKSFVVRHRECIAPVFGSATASYAVASYALNPGMGTTFPWLSGIATRFESYKYNQLRFEYVPQSSTASTGYVDIVPDFDPSDAAPLNHMNASSYSGMVSVSTWAGVGVDVVRANLTNFAKSRFVRTGALMPNLDLKTYDTGNLFVCTASQGSTNQIGWLYATYTVVFTIPQIDSGGEQSGEGMLELHSASGVTSNIVAASTLSGIFTPAGLTTFNLPYGHWLVQFFSRGYKVMSTAYTALSNVTNLFTSVTGYSVAGVDLDVDELSGITYATAFVNNTNASHLISLALGCWSFFKEMEILVSGWNTVGMGDLTLSNQVDESYIASIKAESMVKTAPFPGTGSWYVGCVQRYDNTHALFGTRTLNTGNVMADSVKLFVVGTIVGSGLTAVAPFTAGTNTTLVAGLYFVNAAQTNLHFEFLMDPTSRADRMELVADFSAWTTVTNLELVALPW